MKLKLTSLIFFFLTFFVGLFLAKPAFAAYSGGFHAYMYGHNLGQNSFNFNAFNFFIPVTYDCDPSQSYIVRGNSNSIDDIGLPISYFDASCTKTGGITTAAPLPDDSYRIHYKELITGNLYISAAFTVVNGYIAGEEPHSFTVNFYRVQSPDILMQISQGIDSPSKDCDSFPVFEVRDLSDNIVTTELGCGAGGTIGLRSPLPDGTYIARYGSYTTGIFFYSNQFSVVGGVYPSAVTPTPTPTNEAPSVGIAGGFSDSFTASDGTELNAYNPNVYTYQDNNQPLLSIQNNSLLGLNTYSTVIVNNNDFTDGCMSGDWTGNYINMTIRSVGFQPGETTPQAFYQLFTSPDLGNSFQLNAFYNGSQHRLANGTLDMSGTHNYKICAIGSTVSAYKDGVLIASGTDTGITGSGYETFNQGAPGGSNAILDNLAIVPTTVINEGDTYIKSGSFSDSDSSSWTATVNYGDGSGEQPLSLNGTSFSLNNHYSTQGLYIVTIKVTDNQNATGVLRVTVKVNPTATPTPTNTPTPTPVPNVAPVVGPITVLPNPVQVNTFASATASFTDGNPADTHTAEWNWGDGFTSPGDVTESNGTGSVSGSHVYLTTGVYTVTLTVSDNGSASDTETFKYVSVYNPNPQGLFSGARLFQSPAGADPANPSVTGQVKFGVTAKYQNGIPTGNVSMDFKADNLTFNAMTITALVTASGKATLMGTGTINGAGNYNFLVTGIDGVSDTIRFQITDSSNNVVYDSQLGAATTDDPITAVTGQVIVH